MASSGMGSRGSYADERNIGIDFGTSTTVLCFLDYWVDDQGQRHIVSPADPFKQLHNCDDYRKPIESVIYHSVEGKPILGLAARRKAEEEERSDLLIRNFKMDLLDSDPATAETAIERMNVFFDLLYKQYNREHRKDFIKGQEPRERTFVSYPAKWPLRLQEATVRAAELAGFPEVTGMNEPCAAMQYFLYHEHSDSFELIRQNIIHPGQQLKVLLIDLGGGTTDFVLYNTRLGEPEGHEVLSTWTADTAEPTLVERVNPGEDLKLTITCPKLTEFPVEIELTVGATDTTSTLAKKFASAINDNMAVNAAGIQAFSAGATVSLFQPAPLDSQVLLSSSSPGIQTASGAGTASTNLGGRDTDRLLILDVANHFNMYKKKTNNVVFLEFVKEFEKRRDEVVQFKEQRLSKALEAPHAVVNNVPYQRSFDNAYDILQPKAPAYTLTREKFGKLAQDHLTLFVELTNGAIRNAITEDKIKDESGIDLIVLTGGHSKWYFVADLLSGKWIPGLQTAPPGSGIKLPKIAAEPRRCWTYHDPQTIVAQGLALTNLGYSITGIAQKTLWYDIVISVGEKTEHWTMPVVKKGTALPKERPFFARLRFDRPLADSGDLKVEANLVPVIGENFDNGERLGKSEPLSRKLPLSTQMKDRVRRFLKYPFVREWLDVYLCAKMDQYGNVSYRGIMELGSAGEPWIFKSSREISAEDKTFLQTELSAYQVGAHPAVPFRST